MNCVSPLLSDVSAFVGKTSSLLATVAKLTCEALNVLCTLVILSSRRQRHNAAFLTVIVFASSYSTLVPSNRRRACLALTAAELSRIGLVRDPRSAPAAPDKSEEATANSHGPMALYYGWPIWTKADMLN